MPDEQTMQSLYRNEEQWARQAAASWLGRPEVREAVEAALPEAARILEPLARHLHDQVQITRFCWRVCGVGARFPDGTEEPNPFDPAAPGAWVLTRAEFEAARVIAASFHQLVQSVARVLEQHDVPIDAQWASDQVVIAVLLLLPLVGYEVPWDADPHELADQLQPPGVSAIERNGRGTSARDGRSDTMARNADRIRKTIREEAGGHQLHRPYAAATGHRATRKDTAIRRSALAQVLAEHPGVTVSKLLQQWDFSERTAGGRLRCELTRRLAAEGLPAPDKPSRSALHNDLKSMREPA